MLLAATRASTIAWAVLAEGDPRWHETRCLYAYLAPDVREVLYIGLAWNCSVRERWVRSGKDEFWTDLEEQRGIHAHQTLIGEILPESGTRLTRNLAADLEAVLITVIEPWGNIQRPGLSAGRTFRIRNRGPWPGPARIHTVDG